MRMVVGLGNPGAKYENTRHNIGFMVVDSLKQSLAPNIAWKKSGDALLCEVNLHNEKLFLVKPQSFMNLSGRPVAALQRFYKIDVEDIVVAHDDVDLPFGRIQVKVGGGVAGHNGLKSLSRELGDGKYARVRCGIGRPVKEAGNPEDLMVQWVLGRFGGQDANIARQLSENAANALLTICEQGVMQAQRDFNRKDVGIVEKEK